MSLVLVKGKPLFVSKHMIVFKGSCSKVSALSGT